MKKITEYTDIYVPYRRKNKLHIYSLTTFHKFREDKTLEEVLVFDNMHNRWWKKIDYSIKMLQEDLRIFHHKRWKNWKRIETKEQAISMLQDFINNN